MRSVSTIFLLTLVVREDAKELAVNQAGNVQSSMNKLSNNLFDRAFKSSSLNHSDLNHTTIGKAGQLAIPSRPGLSPSLLPLRAHRQFTPAGSALPRAGFRPQLHGEAAASVGPKRSGQNLKVTASRELENVEVAAVTRSIAGMAVSRGPRGRGGAGRGRGSAGRGRGRGSAGLGRGTGRRGGEGDPFSEQLSKISATLPSWDELGKSAGPPAPRVFEARQRLFGSTAPELKFWHDAAGWCPHCMTAWTVLEEMQIPYVMETSPLRAYLKPGEQKPASLRAVSPKGVVPIVQFIDRSGKGKGKGGKNGGKGKKTEADLTGTAGSWVFRRPVPDVGRGEQVCQMLSKEFPLQALWPKEPKERKLAEWHMAIFKHIQDAYRPYKYLPNGRPTWGVNPKHTKEDKDDLVAALDELETALGTASEMLPEHDKKSTNSLSKARRAALESLQRLDGDMDSGSFLLGHKPYMVDLMLLPYLERIEGLLLHPYLGGSFGLLLEDWPLVSKMLTTGRTPGVCSFSELSCDAETILAVSLRDDGARLPEHAAKKLLGASSRNAQELSLIDSSRLAAEHTAAACKDAAARISANHAAVVGFACRGRGCGRGRRAVEEAVDTYNPSGGTAMAVDIAMRSVVEALLLNESDQVRRATLLEAEARDCARTLGKDAARAVPALRFLTLNIGVPRDMSAASAAALRAHLKLFVKALEDLEAS